MRSVQTSKNHFQIQIEEATKDTIFFSINIQGIELKKEAKILSNIYKMEIFPQSKNATEPKKVGNLNLKYPFKELYAVEELPSDTHFKLTFFLINDTDTYPAIVFAHTLIDHSKPQNVKYSIEKDQKEAHKEQLSISENLLYKYTYHKNGGFENFTDKKEIKKDIMDARHSKKWKDYQNTGYKFAKPKASRDIRKKRMWLVANGIELFGDEYDQHQVKDGHEILQGHWHMGPFYTCDYTNKRKTETQVPH